MLDDDDELGPPPQRKQTLEWTFAIFLILAVFVPALLYLLGKIVSFSFLLLPPFAFSVLGAFVYFVWGKKLLRARRIAGIRDRRLLEEASRRGRGK